MIKRKLQEWRIDALVYSFRKLGTMLFSYINVRTNKYGRTTVMAFADSEREYNISVRDTVEELDKQYEHRSYEEAKE